MVALVQPAIQEPAQKAEVRDTAYDNIQMPALIMAYHIPGMTSDDFYTVSMLNTLLAQGQSSRLCRDAGCRLFSKFLSANVRRGGYPGFAPFPGKRHLFGS